MDPFVQDHCDLEDSKDSQNSLFPCQKHFKLKPEDEISMDSIISYLMGELNIEPSCEQFRNLQWELKAKDFVNEKQYMIFDEKLYISKLKDQNCKLVEDNLIFMEHELQELGTFYLSIEESFDGYVVMAQTKLLKEKTKLASGYTIKGKYNDKLKLICEKRSEYDYVDGAKIEKTLDCRILDSKMIARRETKINTAVQRFKAVINVKGRDELLTLDGGVMLLMRYLVCNNFRGDFNYFTINLFGKILHCQMTVHRQRKEIKLFHRTFTNLIHIVTRQNFNGQTLETSETFYTGNGRMIFHFWHKYDYVIHETKGSVEECVPPPIVPRLELMWRSQNQLLELYRLEKKLTYDNAIEYLSQHSELVDFLQDYLQMLVRYKPKNVLEYTIRYFQKFQRSQYGEY